MSQGVTNVQRISKFFESLEEKRRKWEKEVEKSVRTSFALSLDALEGINFIVDRIGSPKKAFDLMTQPNMEEDILFGDALSEPPPKQSLKRKSFVISKGALTTLNRLAHKKKIKRDTLVENMILKAAYALNEIDEKTLEKQKKIYAILRQYVFQAREIKLQIRQIAGEKDPIVETFSFLVSEYLLDTFLGKIGASLKKGQPILFPIDIDHHPEDIEFCYNEE